MSALIRGKAGRFLPGTAPGPGRPPRQTEAGYLGAMMQACSLDTWREICEKAVVDAKKGDPKAREWLARHLIGDPGHQAPAPTAVIVQQLIGKDPAFDRAVESMIEPSFVELVCDPQKLEAARAAILEREAAGLDRQ